MNAPILIIGAGIAGLSCAQRLAEHGVVSRLFDKGRGPGGRMSARRAEIDGETVRFDHGAQYFTARDADFRKQVFEWIETGIVARWPAAGEDCYVGTPAMNTPIRALAESCDVTWGARALGVSADDKGWQVNLDGETISSPGLVVAIPPEQAAELLDDAAPELALKAVGARSEPCWAMMVAFDDRLPVGDDCLRPATGPISWAARNSAKPGRAGKECWVVHASPDYSRSMIEAEPETVANILLEHLFQLVGAAPMPPIHLATHRWRYAMSGPHPDTQGAVWDIERRFGLAGDWLVEPRVEGAWLSGRNLADLIIG